MIIIRKTKKEWNCLHLCCMHDVQKNICFCNHQNVKLYQQTRYFTNIQLDSNLKKKKIDSAPKMEK